MNLPLKIARRYLFAKRSTNAINIITGIAVFGVAVGTAALILILSVFNGFEDLFLSLYNNFNPDVTITPAKGKTFEPDSVALLRLEQLDGVEVVAQVLEEKALFEFQDNQHIGLLRGVDDQYHLVTGIDSTVREGDYQIHLSDQPTAIIGLGIRNKLGIDVEDPFATLGVYMPKRKKTGLFDSRPFKSRTVVPTGTFLVQQDFENQYVISSIDMVRELLTLSPTACSSLEVKLFPGFDHESTYEAIREIFGTDFIIKDRYEQEASFLRLMRIEKWLSFAIVGLMMLLISFNLIGALWMIVIEKQKDIAILQSMGMTASNVQNLFLLVGVLMCGFGVLCGFTLATVIYMLQTTIGIISLPGGMLIDAYPVSLRWFDFPIVAATVLAIGFLAALLPARRATRVPAIVREE